MEYIVSGIANVAVFIVEVIISFFADSIIAPIGNGLNLFFTYFGVIEDYYVWIQAIGIMIAVGIFAFQAIKSMFYQYSAGQVDSIPLMLFKLVIVVGVIVCFKIMMEWTLTIGTLPINNAGLFNSESYDVTEIIDSVAEHANASTEAYVEELGTKDTSFLSKASTIVSIGASASSGIGLLGAIIVTIALVVLGWKLIKLLLEILERYVLINVILLLSPLALGTAISRSTVSVFRKYLEMVVSAFILLFLDLMFLRVILAAMWLAFSTETLNITLSNGSSPNVILSIFIITALITITTSLDQHLSKLVVTGTTGRQMGIGSFLAMQAAGVATRGGLRSAKGALNKGLTSLKDGANRTGDMKNVNNVSGQSNKVNGAESLKNVNNIAAQTNNKNNIDGKSGSVNRANVLGDENNIAGRVLFTQGRNNEASNKTLDETSGLLNQIKKDVANNPNINRTTATLGLSKIALGTVNDPNKQAAAFNVLTNACQNGDIKADNETLDLMRYAALRGTPLSELDNGNFTTSNLAQEKNGGVVFDFTDEGSCNGRMTLYSEHTNEEALRDALSDDSRHIYETAIPGVYGIAEMNDNGNAFSINNWNEVQEISFGNDKDINVGEFESFGNDQISHNDVPIAEIDDSYKNYKAETHYL